MQAVPVKLSSCCRLNTYSRARLEATSTLHRFAIRQNRLGMFDAHRNAIVHTLDRQSSNERSTNAGPVFCRQDFYWIVATPESLAVTPGFPVEDLFEGLRATGLRSIVSMRSPLDMGG